MNPKPEKPIKYKPIILRPERKVAEPVMQDHEKNVHFKHMANAGDLIYSLPGIRAVVRRTGKRAVVYQVMNQLCTYWGADHPIGNVMFNHTMFDLCKPLLEAQDYIERFEIWDGEMIDYNIDVIREPDNSKALNIPFGDIRQWVMMYFCKMSACIGETWLELEKPVTKSDDLVVVNRTARYQNKGLSYHFLKEYPGPVVFIGVLDEYAEFIKHCPKAAFHKCKTFMEAARLIAASKVFIGNQSSNFAIAEGLGATRMLEVCREAPNVIPATPGGHLYIDQKGMEELFKMLVAE